MKFSPDLERRHDSITMLLGSLRSTHASPDPEVAIERAERSRSAGLLTCGVRCTCGAWAEVKLPADAPAREALASFACASCESMGTLSLAPRPRADGQQRRGRQHPVRARTESVKRMSKKELELGRLLYPTPDDAPPKPRTRAECADVPRPCPFVSCKWNLYLDVSEKTGAIKRNFPDREPEEMTSPSCALDVADDGQHTLEQVAGFINVTRERIRQLENGAARKLKRYLPLLQIFMQEDG